MIIHVPVLSFLAVFILVRTAMSYYDVLLACELHKWPLGGELGFTILVFSTMRDNLVTMEEDGQFHFSINKDLFSSHLSQPFYVQQALSLIQL